MYLSKNPILKKSTHNQRPETIHIKTKNFNRLKALIISATFCIVVLLFVIVDMLQTNQAHINEQYRLQTEINHLHKQLGQESQALDSVSSRQQNRDEKAMSYIESIEQKLAKINSFLTKRGLHGFRFKHASTSNNSKPADDEKIYAKYNNYLEHLVNTVAFMPMGYPRVSAFTSFFGNRGNPFDYGLNEFHPGIDFKGKTGDPVKCTANGVVVFAGRAGGYGNCIRVKHINNIETVYGHLSRISVHKGQKVSVGQVIGKVGSTGRSTGSHLHYEIRRNGHPVNPANYLTLN